MNLLHDDILQFSFEHKHFIGHIIIYRDDTNIISTLIATLHNTYAKIAKLIAVQLN